MRVTQNITTNTFISYIHKHAENLLKTQQQIASQKRINKSSDDPIGMGRVLGYRTNLAAINQYQDNIVQGISRLEFNELTLDSAGDLVGIAERLGKDHTGLGVSAENKQFVAYQVKELYDQIMQLADSKFNGNYIFSGHATDTAPFSHVDYNVEQYHGDDGKVRIMVADNVEVNIDADGSNIFGDDSSGIFFQLKQLIDGLENPDPVAGSAQIEAAAGQLNILGENIDNKRSGYASSFYRLQVTEEYLTNYKYKVEVAMATLEQADITKAVVELQNLELAYETTIATAARIIQPSLLDFLR
jgi:flagellar hook-associated protein 3 FlgL